jgi:hypothetical protein
VTSTSKKKKKKKKRERKIEKRRGGQTKTNDGKKCVALRSVIARPKVRQNKFSATCAQVDGKKERKKKRRENTRVCSR